MMTFEEIREGAVLRLEAGDPEPAFPGIKRIPRGLFRVQKVRDSIFRPIGKREWDTTAEVVRISRAGKQIGTYRYSYAVRFFMVNATLVEGL